MLLIFYLIFKVDLFFVLFSVILLDEGALWLARELSLNFWVLLLGGTFHFSIGGFCWLRVFFIRIMLRFLLLRIQSVLSFSFCNICWHFGVNVFDC
jgi:hypothetical protein